VRFRTVHRYILYVKIFLRCLSLVLDITNHETKSNLNDVVVGKKLTAFVDGEKTKRQSIMF